MSHDEWISEEAAILHIAKALKCSEVLAQRELAHAAAAGWIPVTDREGHLIDPDLVIDFTGEVFYSLVELEWSFPLTGAAKVDAPTPEAPPKPTRKGIGGPTPTYEWHIIFREVIRRVRVDGPPKKITPFAGEIFEWCESEFGANRAPDVETLRKHIGFWFGTRKTLKRVRPQLVAR